MSPDDHAGALGARYSRDPEAYRRYWAPPLLARSRRLLERLPLSGARRVLDVGAGVGTLLAEISRLAPDATVVGVDRAEGMIRLAPANLPRAVMDARVLAFADDTFDVATMAFMLFHLPDPVAGLREVRRALRPGGALGLSTWATDPEVFEANRIWAEELDRHGANPVDPAPARHDLMDSPEKLSALLEEAGFAVEGAETASLEDAMDLEEFLDRRTRLGFSRERFESMDEGARAACLRSARARLGTLGPRGFVSPEVAILAWARRSDSFPRTRRWG